MSLFRLASVLMVGALASTASAQWTVVNLHPTSPITATEAQAFGVWHTGGFPQFGGTGRQAGYAVFGGVRHACQWMDGESGSWEDLNPAGSAQSEAYGTDPIHMVGGYAVFGGVAHAGIWPGGAPSWTDLHPPSASVSVVYGLNASQQVGAAWFGTDSHASLWSYTPGSWVDLHPAGADSSVANGLGGGQQTGSAWFGAFPHAGTWNGSAGSWVDLNPAGAPWSEAFGGDGVQQWGYASTGFADHAGRWTTGTAASWMDLHPAGASHSRIYAMAGGYQAGRATVGGVSHACIWNGTTASWVDLHSHLPAGGVLYTSSEARGIWSDTSGGRTTIYVSGWAHLQSPSRDEAILWNWDAVFGSPQNANYSTLYPATVSSYAYGIEGGQQVGQANVGYGNHASLWTGTPASYVDLNPPGTLTSVANGVQGGRQAGTTRTVTDPPSVSRAGWWSGTAGSFVGLQSPAQYGASSALGEDAGGIQVGTADQHASLWTSTPASHVDLNPAGSFISRAFGASGGYQVGQAFGHAGLWHGTGASWVDLNPAGFTAGSVAYGVQGGHQVGFVDVATPPSFGQDHASLWSGTAASWVDLNPSGGGGSFAYAVSGNHQVGSSAIYASLWSGTASSWVNLSNFLPGGVSNWDLAQARGIWTSGHTTYVVGFAYNKSTGRNEALMWVSNCLDCPADFNCDGALNSQDFFNFLNAFFANDPSADFNHDGAVNSQDFFDFLNAFFAGCP